MPALYDLTGHPQLDEDVVAAGPEYLDWQTRQAEQVLGIALPLLTDPRALELGRDALVLQVNWQESTGVDARMLASSSRAGVTFRAEKGSNLMPLADPQALVTWRGAVAAQLVADGGGDPVLAGEHDPDAWNTVRTRRGR